MGMSDTPSAERVHIGFFGRRNAGKSCVVNAITGQGLSVVSDTLGTTTDPVRKSMELLPLGPVVVIDTPGFDDVGTLGQRRVHATRRVLDQTDLAVLVVDATQGLGACDEQLIGLFRSHNVPYVVAYNKRDLLGALPEAGAHDVYVSGLTGEGIGALKERIAAIGTASHDVLPMLLDLVGPDDLVVLVVPIDKAAPRGRLILPEQMAVRDVLDAGAECLVVQEVRLGRTLERMAPRKPTLVVTDSQVFGPVSRVVPQDVRLTSFSILMARHKGLLAGAVEGVRALDGLADGDRVLVSEGCTHHRQCDDIGTVKLPHWLAEHTGCDLALETTSGRGFPDDVTPYRLVIHCGGCMLNAREMAHRATQCAGQGVPMTNYGIAIAHMKGILRRSLSLFPDLVATLDAEPRDHDRGVSDDFGDGRAPANVTALVTGAAAREVSAQGDASVR